MKLRDPFFISSRLLPALKIGQGEDEATISLEPIGCRNNRLVWRYYIDFKDGREFTDDELSSHGGDSPAETQQMFGTLLAFMSACGESVAYARNDLSRTGENADLFPAELHDWLSAHRDEIGSMQCQLEYDENGNANPEAFITADEEDD